MKEYIERDTFIADQRHLYCDNCERRKGMKNGKMKFVYDIGDAPCRACNIRDMLDSIEDYPSADVVPVVRCGECKHLCVHSEALGVYQCALHGDYPSGEFFCADGERKDGDGDV